MKTFSRLSMFALVCFGFAVMLLGIPADVHAQDVSSLKVAEGDKAIYDVMDDVTVTFEAFNAPDAPAGGETLTITHSSNVSDLSVNRSTNPVGLLEVTGKATAPGSAFIRAVWNEAPGRSKEATANFEIRHIGTSPATIVVKNATNSGSLKIGDTFTQVITIENRDNKEPLDPTLPLSAWQMDVVYNPLVLEVVNVTEGDFLESDGEDAVYAEMRSPGKISVSQARAGQMANASPPPDNVAKAPSPEGIALNPGDKGTLLTIQFKVLAVAEETLGIHNVRLQSSKDFDELPEPDVAALVPDADRVPDRISYSILVSDVIVTTHQSPTGVDIDGDGDLDEMDELNPVDVNQDGMVNIQDLVVVAGSIGGSPANPRADVNDDGFVNVLDLISIYTSPLWAKSVELVEVNRPNEAALTAPSVNRNVGPATIQSWIDLARVEDDGSAIFDLGIANLEALLASRIPSETKLLLNYPNPFNPETWIPYQLAKSTEVTVTIHAMNGSVVRTLELGHQAAGTYKSKSQAAYWDGRNEFGEQVASGLYFYTLTAGDFSATHKMLVRK